MKNPLTHLKAWLQRDKAVAATVMDITLPVESKTKIRKFHRIRMRDTRGTLTMHEHDNPGEFHLDPPQPTPDGDPDSTTITLLAPPSHCGCKTYEETYRFILRQSNRAAERYFWAIKQYHLTPWYNLKTRYVISKEITRHKEDSYERSCVAEDYRKAMMLMDPTSSRCHRETAASPAPQPEATPRPS